MMAHHTLGVAEVTRRTEIRNRSLGRLLRR
jgi:hypothetical protein